MTQDLQAHWEGVYQTKAADNVSWYQHTPERSLALIHSTQLGTDARMIDVGAGASTLVDHLLNQGYRHLTLLDISAAALQIARDRLSPEHQAGVNWLVGDITAVSLPQHAYDIWHDRAVFHFLTDAAAQERYVQQVVHALKPGGYLIMATFAQDGPNQCSGLDVMRYTPGTLHQAFGDAFELVESVAETHVTPWSTEQRFIYCFCRKSGIGCRDQAPALQNLRK